MQNTSYVLVPYQEYQELLVLKKEKEQEELEKIFFERIEDKLDLSIRSLNGLSANKSYDYEYNSSNRTYTKIFNDKSKKLIYIGDLVLLRPMDIIRIENLGRKSLREIETELKKYNLNLGMNLPNHILEKLNKIKT